MASDYSEKARKSFVLLTKNIPSIDDLPDEDAGKLFKAIYHYAASGFQQIDDVPVRASATFALIRSEIDDQKGKYIDSCIKKQAALDEYRKKNSKNEITEDNCSYLSLSSVGASDNENDTDSETEGDTEIESLSIPNGIHKRNNNKLVMPEEGLFLAEYVREAWIEFETMRERIKKSLTENTKVRLIKKLERLAGGDPRKAEKILLYSVDNCYPDLYEWNDSHRGRSSGKEEVNLAEIANKLSACQGGEQWT